LLEEIEKVDTTYQEKKVYGTNRPPSNWKTLVGSFVKTPESQLDFVE